MSTTTIINTLLNIAQLAKLFPSPATQALAAVAHILQTEVLTPMVLEKKIPQFIDADGDGIDDTIDPDHGEVCAITDEMLHAGINAVADYSGGNSSLGNYILEENLPKSLTAAYLAMYAARPKNS